LVKIRIGNTNNNSIKKTLENIINEVNLDEIHSKKHLEDDFHDKTEFKSKIGGFFIQKKLNIEQIKKKMRIILKDENKKNQDKIDWLQRENIAKNLTKYEIKDPLKKKL
jgi:hypothetical protein